MRDKRIITNNKEVYNKFNQLNFSSEVVLNNVSEKQVKKIINNINKQTPVISMNKVGEYIVLKRNKPLNIAVYLR